MATRIVTDGSADLPFDYLQKHNITMIEMTFRIGGEEHIAYANPDTPGCLSMHGFYDRMRAGETPTTAQINLITYLEAFEPIVKAGDDILFISFSSALSGSINNAVLAANELTEKYPQRRIRVVDSLSASTGEGMVVHLAATKLAELPDVDDLARYVEEHRLTCHHWFTVDDLVYLKRGGRVSAAAAIIGTVLNIKPVLNVNDQGQLIPKEKTQGRKKALRSLVDHMEEKLGSREYDGPIFIGHCDAPEDADFVAKVLKQRFNRDPDLVYTISPIVGSHSGPGTMALFFVSDAPRG